MNKSELTAARLREVAHYNPDTGFFVARVTRSSRAVKGAILGKPNAYGYTRIMVDGVNYLAHRLAWLYMTGDWPPSDMDHKDTNRGNNAFANLRLATRRQNQANRGANKNNKSGFKGVSRCSRTGKWRAMIKVNYKQSFLGVFDDPEDAHAAYVSKAQQIHGEFARAA